MGLGEELRKARQAAGMTQEDLAAKARMDRAYISEIERGIASPSVDRFLRLCDAMKTRAADIVDRLQYPSRHRR